MTTQEAIKKAVENNKTPLLRPPTKREEIQMLRSQENVPATLFREGRDDELI